MKELKPRESAQNALKQELYNSYSNHNERKKAK